MLDNFRQKFLRDKSPACFMLRHWSWRWIARQSQHLPTLTAAQLYAVGLCADYLQAERHPFQQEISGKLAPEALMTTCKTPCPP